MLAQLLKFIPVVTLSIPVPAKWVSSMWVAPEPLAPHVPGSCWVLPKNKVPTVSVPLTSTLPPLMTSELPSGMEVPLTASVPPLTVVTPV